MHTRTALLLVCLLGTVGAVVASHAEKERERSAAAPLRIELVPEGNLQVGVPGELLAEPIEVRTRPGAEVRFFSPDLGVLEESGGAAAIVRADENGVARVRLRLGENLGQYTVIAAPARGDGSEVVYTARAIDVEAMRLRRERHARVLAEASRATGGAR